MAAPQKGSSRARDAALIAVLYRTGMLYAEARALTLSHLDLTAGHEFVLADGADLVPRRLGLDQFALDALKPWLEERSHFPGDYLFCITMKGTEIGRQMSPGWGRGTLKRHGLRAGLGETRVHNNAFRHTLAAELMVEQWPIPYIMAQLGITELTSLKNTFDNLGIVPPPDDEVAEIVRRRI